MLSESIGKAEHAYRGSHYDCREVQYLCMETYDCKIVLT